MAGGVHHVHEHRHRPQPLQVPEGVRIEEGLVVRIRAPHLDEAHVGQPLRRGGVQARRHLGRTGVGHHFEDDVLQVGVQLQRLPRVEPPPLVLQESLHHLARGDAVPGGEAEVAEPLVVSEVEVQFPAVLRYEDLPVLPRRHAARARVQVRVHLHEGYRVAPLLQHVRHRAHRNSLSQSADRTSDGNHVFHDYLFKNFLL